MTEELTDDCKELDFWPHEPCAPVSADVEALGGARAEWAARSHAAAERIDEALAPADGGRDVRRQAWLSSQHSPGACRARAALHGHLRRAAYGRAGGGPSDRVPRRRGCHPREGRRAFCHSTDARCAGM